MYRPRKATISDRALLSQEARVFLEPELAAPAGAWRKVQVMIPNSPDVFITIDGKPLEIGLNRNYKVPPFPPGAAIVFSLLPEQTVMGMSGEGIAIVSYIVEFFGGE